MKKLIVLVMLVSLCLSQVVEAKTITNEKERKVLEILEKYDYTTTRTMDNIMFNEFNSKNIINDYNKKLKELEKYKLGDYVKLEGEVNGWVIDDIGQEVAHEYAKGSFIKYVLYLSMQYKEGAKNDDECMHYNDNGTVDVGRTQQNCRIDDIEKIEKMKKPKTNLMNGFYELNEILEECNNNYCETMISYNGGYKSRDFVRHGIWTINCQAGKYMQDFCRIIDEVLEEYKRTCTNEMV